MALQRKDRLACALALAALLAGPALAEPRSINIPSEEAAKSIPEFARQENIQIVAPVSQLHGIKTQAVSGHMELGDALKALLVGTGLEVASNDGGTIVLRRAVAAAPVVETPEGIETGLSLPETIIVTGSRVIADASNSPTPVTIVSTKQLRDTTPSNLADGLNKLPIFQGSQIIGRPGDGSHNFSSNVLNLRNFGGQRTLVLLDGHRATPSNDDGTVDVDTLPQMLISRVDIVTGGASAVYGSDAVTGVVNFVLDRKFDGLKTDFNAGISTYADAMSYNLGVAGGMDLFGGRGHFEASAEWRHRDPVNQSARPYGPTTLMASNGEAGTGTAADPFNVIANARRPNSSFGGVVQGCVPACPLAAGTQFAANGVLSPFFPGVAGATNAAGAATAGTSNFNSGGDGAYNPYGQVFDGYHQGTFFSRFSYDLADNITFYLQGQAAEAYSFGWYFPQKIQPGVGQADIFYKNNPFLSAAVQTQLGNNGTNPTQLSSTVQAGNTFQLGEFLVGNGQTEINATGSVNRLLSIQTGFDGTLMNGRFAWNLFYSHGENRLAVDLINNQNLQHMYAAQDAVLTPGGTVACYAATQPATAVQYADCVPINPFGPTAVSQAAFKYVFQTTAFHETNTLNDMGGSIAGTVLNGWAGPITAALSGEARFNAYDIGTNVPSSTFVDCTGLRLCNPLLPSYSQAVLQSVHASQNVWEAAVEAEVPVLKSLPLVEAFDLNLAGRYTSYSVSGSVQTWKIGFNWNVVGSLRFRGTTSIDIRAPTLNDLFQPATILENVFTDLHIPTGPNSFQAGTTAFSSQGNPRLVPEVARTYTVGAVWTPEFISGLTVSLDYYRIHLANAIGQIAPSTTIQTLCEASGGISIYCANYQRPLPFSDHSLANFATTLFTFNLNTASVQTEGWDFESNYGWQMSDLVEGWNGSWSARLLATYQPVIQKSVLFPGAAFTRVPDPSTRITAFLTYALNDWNLGVEDEWVSGFSQVAGPVTATINNWVNPHVNAWNQVDANISRNFQMEGAGMTAYFVVQNLLNAQPAYVPNGTIGQIYPTAQTGLQGYSVQSPMGRTFTLGIRANL
jgi:outer membrane receptor protein involved in Fe transport